MNERDGPGAIDDVTVSSLALALGKRVLTALTWITAWAGSTVGVKVVAGVFLSNENAGWVAVVWVILAIPVFLVWRGYRRGYIFEPPKVAVDVKSPPAATASMFDDLARAVFWPAVVALWLAVPLGLLYLGVRFVRWAWETPLP